MAAILTTIRVEVVKITAIRKPHSRESPPPESLSEMGRFRKTPGEQDPENKSGE